MISTAVLVMTTSRRLRRSYAENKEKSKSKIRSAIKPGRCINMLSKNIDHGGFTQTHHSLGTAKPMPYQSKNALKHKVYSHGEQMNIFSLSCYCCVCTCVPTVLKLSARVYRCT